MNLEVSELQVVFILGIMPRSGTHFLGNLLCEHPDCVKSVVPEDGLVSKSNSLTKFASNTDRQWQIEGGMPNIPAKEMLLESLGEGLKTFLRRAHKKINPEDPKFDTGFQPVHKPKYLITKSPQVVNIDKFFSLFPDEKLLIIVRDGRALVESIHRSFKYNIEEAMTDIAMATHRIGMLEKAWENKRTQYMIIKYEELYTNTEYEMRKIFDFLGLDKEVYDFEAALNLPVVGSSVFKRGNGAVHWSPVSKTEEFNPLERASSWTRKQHERFNWLAKNALLYFGYKPKEFANYKTAWLIWNYFMDFKYGIKIGCYRISKLIGFIRTRLKSHFIKK